MTETAPARTRIRIDLASELTAAYVSKNAVPVADLPDLIASIGATLDRILRDRTSETGLRDPRASEGTRTAVRPADVTKSITREALISFIDGRPYKTLKRHIATHGLTPEEYRARFGLPADYPMVSQSYSERRAAIARSISLGKASGRGRKGQP